MAEGAPKGFSTTHGHHDPPQALGGWEAPGTDRTEFPPPALRMPTRLHQLAHSCGAVPHDVSLVEACSWVEFAAPLRWITVAEAFWWSMMTGTSGNRLRRSCAVAAKK